MGTYEKSYIANRIMNGGEITKKEAIELIHTSDDDTMILLAMADKIRQHFNDNSVDVCAIVMHVLANVLKTVNSVPNLPITKQVFKYIRSWMMKVSSMRHAKLKSRRYSFFYRNEWS